MFFILLRNLPISIWDAPILAVAGMQTTAITANASAKDATIAIQMAEEMIDRIRVNAGDTPEIYTNIDTNNNCAGLTDPALGDCTQWRARLIDASLGLSGARGTITVTDDSPISKTATVTVTITWGAISTRSITYTTIMETWLT